MNRWRRALQEWVSNSPEHRAIKDDHFDLTWKEVERALQDLSTIPLDWSEPLVIAGQRNSHTILAIWWTLINDGVGLNLERQQLATMLPRLVSTLTSHNLLLHEVDLKGFETILRDLGYDLGQMTVLDVFEPDPLLGHIVVLPYKTPISVQRCPSECGWILMTSGSTMAPKLVMIDRQDLVARADAEIRDFEIVKEDAILNVLPTSHDVGFNQVLSWILSGSRLVVQAHPSTDRFRNNLLNEKVTGVSGTPMMWLNFLNKVSAGERFLGVRYCAVSGGALSLQDLDGLRARFRNATVFRTYGQTETFRSLMAKDPPGSELRATHGRPILDVRLKLLDDSGLEVGIGQEGELSHEGVGGMLGYFPSPLKWREVRTGDYFRCDDAGQFTYLGRRDDLIKRWEIRMHLSEVEEALRGFPGVLQVCVIHRKVEDSRQNALAAFLVIAEQNVAGSESSENEVLEYCKRVLSPSKVPDRIFFEASLPETASRKVDRNVLREKWESADGE